MRRLLIAGVLAGLVTTFVPATAHASCVGQCDLDWYGSCHFASLNDTTPGGVLGGQSTWTGDVDLDVVAIDRSTGLPVLDAPISASCEIRVNSVPEVVVGPVTGTGAVVAVTPVQYRAEVTDIVTLCTRVTVGANPEEVDCWGEHLLLLEMLTDGVTWFVVEAADEVFDLLDDTYPQLDPVICAQLVALAPLVDGLGHPELIDIDPATGDLFLGGVLLGDHPSDLFWDCPPYAS